MLKLLCSCEHVEEEHMCPEKDPLLACVCECVSETSHSTHGNRGPLREQADKEFAVERAK